MLRLVHFVNAALLMAVPVGAQYFPPYGYGRFGCPLHPMTMPSSGVDPYSSMYGGYGMMNPMMNPMMNQMMNPMLTSTMGYMGQCVDLSPQCSVWASTGQCSTNPLVMRRMCGMSCGTCTGTGLGLGYGGGLGLGGLGYTPYATTGLLGSYPYGMGRSIYEQGLLRSPLKTSITPGSAAAEPFTVIKKPSTYLPQRMLL